MYSHEIEEYIKLRNYILNIKEYIEVVGSSPQIDHIKYEDEHFQLDTTDNFHFKIKLKTRENNP